MICIKRLIPFLSHRQCVRIILSTRPMSNAPKVLQIEPKSRLLDKQNYKIVYDLPAIKFCAAFLRLKYSYPILCLICCPIVYHFEKSWTMLAVIGVVGILNTGIFFAITSFLSNTIGKIYVNKEGDVEDLIFSVVNKSGRRQDHKLSCNELCVLDPTTRIHAAIGVVPVLVKDSNNLFKLYLNNLARSKVCDNETFVKLFGKESLKKIKK